MFNRDNLNSMLKRASILFLSLSIIVFLSACKKSRETNDQQNSKVLADSGRMDKPRPYPTPFPDSVKNRQLSFAANSKEELCINLLEALQRSDTTALANAMVSQREFKEWLWWEFPASTKLMNVPVDFAWDNLAQKSSKGLRTLLYKYAGMKLALLSYRFEEGEDRYQTFTLHVKTRLEVEDDKGKKITINEFGSFVEMNGKWKLFSYRDRD
jgi:hypothetical protein